MNPLPVLLAAWLAMISASEVEVEKKDMVKLTLFYESYCPYSVDFITNQLYPTWADLKNHIRLDMVPFGNAQQTYDHGHFKFTCQHGEKECVGNILHACAIHEACHGRHTQRCPVKHLAKAMDYIDCVVKEPDQKKASDKCATKSNLKPKVINKCATGKLGEVLESGYGNETKAFNNPPVNYVPFIVINGKHDEAEQDAAQSDLKGYLCKLIPKACK